MDLAGGVLQRRQNHGLAVSVVMMNQRSLIVAACFAAVYAQTTVNCPLNGGNINDSILVTTNCKISGTSINGSVILEGGTLTLKGGASVSGSIEAKSGGAPNLVIKEATVLGRYKDTVPLENFWL